MLDWRFLHKGRDTKCIHTRGEKSVKEGYFPISASSIDVEKEKVRSHLRMTHIKYILI